MSGTRPFPLDRATLLQAVRDLDGALHDARIRAQVCVHPLLGVKVVPVVCDLTPRRACDVPEPSPKEKARLVEIINEWTDAQRLPGDWLIDLYYLFPQGELDDLGSWSFMMDGAALTVSPMSTRSAFVGILVEVVEAGDASDEEMQRLIFLARALGFRSIEAIEGAIGAESEPLDGKYTFQLPRWLAAKLSNALCAPFN